MAELEFNMESIDKTTVLTNRHYNYLTKKLEGLYEDSIYDEYERAKINLFAFDSLRAEFPTNGFKCSITVTIIDTLRKWPLT